MGLNKSKGNMYHWPDMFGDYTDGVYTWNPIGGECKDHLCEYCYVNPQKKQRPVIDKKYSGDHRLIEHEMKTHIGSNRIIFVESMSDLFAKSVPADVIIRVLEHCNKFPDNKYLFQSKNPIRFGEFIDKFPPNYIIGTTIETDEYYSDTISKAPALQDRADALAGYDCMRMVSVEPVLDFNPIPFSKMLLGIKPDFVSIGADSQNCNLKEPSPNAIRILVGKLRENTKVKLKDNLERIMGKKAMEELDVEISR